MKKFLILGVFVFVASFSALAADAVKESEGVECPNGCETSSSACCKTKGGSTYYGKL